MEWVGECVEWVGGWVCGVSECLLANRNQLAVWVSFNVCIINSCMAGSTARI